MFTCDVVDIETNKSILKHMFQGSNSVRDLVTMVAVTLSKRSDEIVLMHENAMLSPRTTRSS